MGGSLIIRIIFVAEIAAFVWLFMTGGTAVWHQVTDLRQESDLVQISIKSLESDVCELDREISAWQSNSLLKEKYAREQLQMAHPNDIVFLVREQ